MNQFHSDDLLSLWRGDCRALTLPEPADHILTDLPYAEQTHRGARTDIKTRLIDFDSVTFDQVLEYLRFLTPLRKRWLIAFMDWRHVAQLEPALEAGAVPGLRFVRFGIWDKPNGAPQFTGDRPGTGWEAIAIMHRAGGCGGMAAETARCGGRIRSRVSTGRRSPRRSCAICCGLSPTRTTTSSIRSRARLRRRHDH